MNIIDVAVSCGDEPVAWRGDRLMHRGRHAPGVDDQRPSGRAAEEPQWTKHGAGERIEMNTECDGGTGVAEDIQAAGDEARGQRRFTEIIDEKPRALPAIVIDTQHGITGDAACSQEPEPRVSIGDGEAVEAPGQVSMVSSTNHWIVRRRGRPNGVSAF